MTGALLVSRADPFPKSVRGKRVWYSLVQRFVSFPTGEQYSMCIAYEMRFTRECRAGLMTIVIHYGVSGLGNEHKTAFHLHEMLYKQIPDTLFPPQG